MTQLRFPIVQELQVLFILLINFFPTCDSSLTASSSLKYSYALVEIQTFNIKVCVLHISIILNN